ncbi:MAG: ATP-binding cassette domain-containing protein [Bacteroidia bacterium]|nr:ATP-binding cassette domain-containing protein [Bacteroidia bacterium]
MSERILRALIQLFAIGASLERLTLQSRAVVEGILRQQLSQHRINEYLTLFDTHLQALEGKEDQTKARKRIALSSVKALRICTEINKELNTSQKYIVFIRLVEFMHSSDVSITEPEKEFLETVATVFNIEQKVQQLCVALTERNVHAQGLESASVLCVQSQKDAKSHTYQQLEHTEVDQSLWFLNIEPAGMFFLRYTGKDLLTVNGKPVVPNSVSVFTQGAVLRGQKIQALYYSDVLRFFTIKKEERRIQLRAENLEFTFKNGKKGLHTLNFSSHSGELVAIMGGSGAGKSTLLSVLNGTSPVSSGRLLLNGKDVYKDAGVLEGMIGNIPQDDLLIEELSVFQNLFYNTKLVFGKLSDEEIREKVMAMLDSLGLTETADLKVGNPLNKTISGGQRKRLNIALELIREPAVLFVDEPTSGLSSHDAENVMDLLKQLTLSGKLVFVVIHQPSSDIFRMFDRLLILDTGGYPIYYGNPSDSLIYFKRQAQFADADRSECPACGTINAEQIFNIIGQEEVDEFGNRTNSRKVSPQEWFNYHKQNIAAAEGILTENEKTVAGGSNAGYFRQWRVFFTRDFLSKLSNRQYMAITLLEAPLLAGILGFILRYTTPGESYSFTDNPNLPAYLFICVIVALFLGMTASAEEIIRDRKILQREKFLNLSRQSYLFSKIALLFLVSAIQSLSFVLIGNLIFGVQDMLFQYWWVLFSTACFANLVGLNISSGLDSVVTIYILIPFLIIPQILLSGVIVKFEKLNPLISNPAEVPLIGNVMASRWAFEALSIYQFQENQFQKDFYPMDAKMSEATFKKDWWLAVLRERTDKSERLIGRGVPSDSIKSILQLVYNELNKEQNENPRLKLNPASLNVNGKQDMTTVQAMRKDIEQLKDFYIEQFNSSSELKETIIEGMTNSPEKLTEFKKRKRDYYNESLDQLVRNSTGVERLRVYENEVIQYFEPVYRTRPSENALSGMFFTPTKSFLGQTYNTFSVNIVVIWGMTILFYLTLTWDLLRKILMLGTRFKKK